ncbi:MAG: hypothetical protein AAF639_33660 [Chloroflexota bacterium]
MYTSHQYTLSNDQGHRISFYKKSSPLPYRDVLHLWQHDASFRTFFITLLADTPFTAFRWETPPITTTTADRPFECVLLNSPGLARRPDIHAFSEYFPETPSSEIVIFANLGGDATLVVPCPAGEHAVYGHLAAFVRHALEAQQHTLWTAVGMAMEQRLSDKPVWLSTAGGGVSWLHVRLDDRPKYYGYAPYRRGE